MGTFSSQDQVIKEVNVISQQVCMRFWPTDVFIVPRSKQKSLFRASLLQEFNTESTEFDIEWLSRGVGWAEQSLDERSQIPRASRAAYRIRFADRRSADDWQCITVTTWAGKFPGEQRTNERVSTKHDLHNNTDQIYRAANLYRFL